MSSRRLDRLEKQVNDLQGDNRDGLRQSLLKLRAISNPTIPFKTCDCGVGSIENCGICPQCGYDFIEGAYTDDDIADIVGDTRAYELLKNHPDRLPVWVETLGPHYAGLNDHDLKTLIQGYLDGWKEWVEAERAVFGDRLGDNF